jgi:hypothetical protein
MTELERFPNGCVATPHYLASSAGLAVLAQGGNAVDAAVAANLTMGVVAPYMCGYGGDLFAIVWAPPERSGGDAGQLHAYNGSGRSSKDATPDRVRDALGSDEMPLPHDPGPSVQELVEGGELLREIGEAIQTTLTPHQREVLVAVALNDVPIDVMAERLGSTRGALYKTIHDARHKLRRRLQADGHA